MATEILLKRVRKWTPEQLLRRAEQNKNARKLAKEAGKCGTCKTRWAVTGFLSCTDCMGPRSKKAEIPANLLWMEDGESVW